MAGILNPKTRFFDTFITREGRRQLANGEIRTRFISFSDNCTAYDQSEPGVIDTKDGSVFFEAMSRPQDTIVTENPSIINMMELRNPTEQPLFLTKEITTEDADGNEVTHTALTQASMFGKEILVPPDGRTIEEIVTAGIKRKNVDYDPTAAFYISGSRSQELFYDAAATGLKGWWVFDSTLNQLNEFIDPPFLNFEKDIQTSRTIAEINGVAGTAEAPITLSSSTTSIKFNGAIDFSPSVGDVVGFKDDETGERIAFEVVSLPGGDNTLMNVKYTAAFSVNLIQAAEGDVNSERDSNPHMVMLATAVDRLDFLSANISQNLSSSSPLSTNAAYRIYEQSLNLSVIDSSPVFVDPHLSSISDLRKSYKARQNSFIHINLKQKHYNTFLDSEGKSLYGEDWGAGTSGKMYRNQISVWFYVQTGNPSSASPDYGGFDSGLEQTIIQTFSSDTKKKFEIFTVNDDLKMRYYDNAGDEVEEVTISANSIDPENWHRVSVAYGPASTIANGQDAKALLHVTLDGDKRKSLALSLPRDTGEDRPGKYLFSTITDLVLGASLDNLSSQPTHNRRLMGYIQECQYFIKPSFGDEEYIQPTVPALLSGSVINNKYNDQISVLTTAGYFNLSGQFPENADVDDPVEVDNLIRYSTEVPDPSIGTSGAYVTLSGSVISSRSFLREWVHYNPIRNEAALYFAGKGSQTYVKESQLERGVSRTTVKEVAALAKSTMSGSLFAYRQLGLLQHLDLDVPVSGSAPLTIKRTAMLEMQTANPGQGNLVEVNEIAESDTRFFKTRLKEFPVIEPIYGKTPNNYETQQPISIDNAAGPASGKFLENAGTVYHLEEIIDNEIDDDEITRSSSRIPNYFLLPPLATDNFKFQHDGKIDSLEDMMSWREFLRRRSTFSTQDLDKARAGEVEEKYVGRNTSDERYLELMRTWFKNLIPEETMKELLKRFGTSSIQDSNNGLIQYLIRDVNISGGGPRNNIDFPLERFNELITFEKTSLSNNSFIQMFECAQEDGKPSFTKLAIMDLGIKRTYPGLDHGSSYYWYTTSGKGRFKRGVTSDAFDREDRRNRLSHVFAFGKLIDKNTNPSEPGSEIYFFPLFSLECELEDDN